MWDENAKQFFGTVEVDEAYIGGLERNKHKKKKLKAGRRPIGKKPVIAFKERKSKRVKALTMASTDYGTILREIIRNVSKGAQIYTDEHSGYTVLKHLGYGHESVHHRSGEYVKGEAHTNGVESFWASLKRGYHKMSVKHLQRYINEFSNRTNVRPLDTIDQINLTLKGLVGKRLRYQDLIR